MDKADCFKLGHIAKLHGFKGEVSLFLDVTNPEDYLSLDAFFVDINNLLTPFFVNSLKMKPNGFASVKLEGVDSENDAKILLRNEVFLPAEILPELSGTEFYDHEVIGFTVIDAEFGEVGIIQQIIDLPSNPLIQVDRNGKEILIPLIPNLVQKVDRKDKKLHIQAPEGLIEIYLS